MNRFADTRDMSRSAWLEARRAGIGGSDAAAILGASPWATPLSVWADKQGLTEDKPDTIAMRFGRDAEEIVARWFAEDTGKTVARCNAKLTVVDVREGEFQSFDRLTETLSVNWIEDEGEREKREIVGWIGYFKLTNGFEKAVYMSRNDVLRHEKKHRKGQEMSRAWREDFNVMAEKTVLRKLLGKYALLSVTYQQADPAAIRAADDLMRGCAEEDALEAEAAVE